MEFEPTLPVERAEADRREEFKTTCGTFKRAVDRRLRELTFPRDYTAKAESAELRILSLHLALLLLRFVKGLSTPPDCIIDGAQARFVETVNQFYG